MRKLIFGITMIMILFTAINANAAGYFSLKGGLYEPDMNYDTAYNAEVAIGIKVNPYFIIDIGGGYQFVEQEYSQAVSDDKLKWTENYSLIPITLTFKGNYPIQDKVEIYGGGGIGYYFARKEYGYEHTYTTYDYTWYYPYYRTVTKTTKYSYSSNANALGYQAVIGCDFNVSKNFALGLEAKWFHVKPEFDYEYEILGTTFRAEDVPTDLGGWIFNAGLKIRF
jgi:outer membrane protein W